MDRVPFEVPLLSRQEQVLRGLDVHIGTMQQQIRTQIHGLPKVWQPSKYLPDFSNMERAAADVQRIQAETRKLSPELLVVLIGDTLTEEGLPTFLSRLFTLRGLESSASGDIHNGPSKLQQFFREWAGEEHRHGVLLNAFLRLCGRVDMQAYEQSVQLFLNDGLDLGIEADPYNGFVYTSFQELATQRSHMNVARIAKQQGAPRLAQICGQIASDESHHAKVYIEFVRYFFEKDPNGMMLALQHMLQKGITMPAHLMREVDRSGNVLAPGESFAFFSDIAQRLGVYTAQDYAAISAELLSTWGVGNRLGDTWQPLMMPGLEEPGRDAQAKILRRQTVIEKMAMRPRSGTLPDHDWSWLVQA